MTKQDWLRQLGDASIALDGKHRLVTKHTVYLFDDGVCVDVARRDGEEGSAQASLIGTRLAAWLLDVEGQQRLLSRWLPGARAVLRRAGVNGARGKLVVTSRTLGFVQSSQPDSDDDETTAVYTPLQHVPPSPESHVRLFL